MNIRTLPFRLLTPFLDFLYPPVCLTCNAPLQNGGQKVCKDCWNAIPRITNLHPLYQQTRTRLLEERYCCDLVSCFVFEKDGPFQHIVHALKYNEYKSLGLELGRCIGETIKDSHLKIDILVPVPLHRIKYRERGYNQSEYIARGIASVVNKPVVLNAVHRTRYTETQTKLNSHERRKNMEHAFELIPRASRIISGNTCLLVDDVITTGATTNACAQVLCSGGAEKIIAASAALAE